jgi:hypothetical protein
LRHRYIGKYQRLTRTVGTLQLQGFNHTNQAIRDMRYQGLARRANVFLNFATLGAATAMQ